MLDRLIKKMNEPEPEFVNEKWVADYIKKDVDYVRKIKLCEMVPFRLDEKGHKIYKTSVIKHRVMKYKLMPPSTDHPLFEMTQEEAMVYLNIHSPAKYMKHVRAGDIKVHLNANGKKRVYREDADEFLRTFDRLYLLKYVRGPLLFTDAALLFGFKLSNMRYMLKTKRIEAEPRKKYEVRKVSQETMLKFAQDRVANGHKFRRNPIPEYMPRSVAEIYCAAVPEARNAVRGKLVKCEQYTTPDGKTKWGISKAKLDSLISKCWRGRCYGSGKQPYYNARQIEYIFGKTQAWIDTFIRGKCPRVDKYGDRVEKKEAFNRICGWEKKAVEEIIASGVEYCPVIRMGKTIKNPEPKRFTTPKPKTVITHSVVDIIESAFDNAYSEREFAKEQHARDIIKARNDKKREREAMRIELGFEPTRELLLRRDNVLKYSENREIISLVYTNSGCDIYKDRSLTKYDLAVFVRDRDLRLRRRVTPNSSTRLVLRGIEYSIVPKVKMLPEWIIIVPGTSIINDINLYETLRGVPQEIMAVAPFGYEYTQFDGTWSKCTRTYGYYQIYNLSPASNQMVLGSAEVNGCHRVEVLDGPFVAVRGEMLDKLKEIHYFNVLGECRGAMGPIVSAICRRYRLGMMQVPVSSSCAAGYAIPFDSPKWHEIEDRIINYVSATEQAIAFNRRKELCKK